jgi:hypothetical protein
VVALAQLLQGVHEGRPYSHQFRRFRLISQSISEWMFSPILVMLYRCSLATSQTISQIARRPRCARHGGDEAHRGILHGKPVQPCERHGSVGGNHSAGVAALDASRPKNMRWNDASFLTTGDRMRQACAKRGGRQEALREPFVFSRASRRRVPGRRPFAASRRWRPGRNLGLPAGSPTAPCAQACRSSSASAST